ncbi:hypothetical protein [Acetobacterium sp.]|jgi:type I restriction enzyme R subunit|uniref:hypothetical protein n=1 Tax=Acetobacterium sp. TaxID=1872094 RepID=UPI00351D4E97
MKLRRWYFMADSDEPAKRFDNLIYGLMLSQIEALQTYNTAKRQLCGLMNELEKKITIPQIQTRLPLIQTVTTDEFWAAGDLLAFEKVRQELCELIKFIIEEGQEKSPVITSLYDPILNRNEGLVMEAAYDYGDYKMKVNCDVNDHQDTLAIQKLRKNISLSQMD